MNAPKFTPGPWKLETVATQVGSCHKIGPFPGSATKPENHACVYADGEYWLTERLTERGKILLANARLIAAAPELLDQCERAATILHNVIEAGQIGRGYATNLADLQTVIAKARGEGA